MFMGVHVHGYYHICLHVFILLNSVHLAAFVLSVITKCLKRIPSKYSIKSRIRQKSNFICVLDLKNALKPYAKGWLMQYCTDDFTDYNASFQRKTNRKQNETRDTKRTRQIFEKCFASAKLPLICSHSIYEAEPKKHIWKIKTNLNCVGWLDFVLIFVWCILCGCAFDVVTSKLFSN